MPEPRRAAPGTELRTFQDALPRCADGSTPVLSGDGTERAMLIALARQRGLEALEHDEQHRVNHGERDHGKDRRADEGLRLDAPGRAQRDGRCYAGHTLTVSGGKASDTAWPSFHSRVRGTSSTMRCSPPRLTRAS